MSGWFAVKHGIRKHPIFKGRPDRLGAWIAILDEAAWADTRQLVGGAMVDIKRGELCASQAMLEEITGLSRKQLRTFLDILKKEGVVKSRPGQKGAKSRAILTVCNYEKYQSLGPSKGQEGAKEGPTKEQDKQIPVGGAEKSAPDLASIIFQDGLRVLVGSGVKEAQARSILGKWRKDNSDADVIAAIGKAQREGSIDPVAFISGCFRHEAKTVAPAGYVDAGAFGMIPERN